jgi:hypothetical protein
MKTKHLSILCVLGLAISVMAGPFEFPSNGAGGSGSSAWSDLTGVPAGFADDEDGTGNWTASGSSGTYLMGNTGIGTTAPSTQFTVKVPNNDGEGITVQNASDSVLARIGYRQTNSSGYLELYTQAGFPNVRYNANGASWFAANGTGSFGVGTSTPLATLHVAEAAGAAGNTLIVSTGGIPMLQVQGTSITARLPFHTTSDITALVYHGDGSQLTGIVSGGASTLAVGTGTPSGIGVVTSSPTAILNFDKNQFNGTLPAGSTFFLTIKPEIDLTASSFTVTGAGFRIVGSTIATVTGKLGIGTFTPSHMLHITTTAGTTSTLMTVSTGSIDLFKVNGTSVALRVPLWLNRNSLNDVGTIAGGEVSGNFVLSDTLHSSMTFVTSEGTNTITAAGMRTMGTQMILGNSGNASAIVVGSTVATFSTPVVSTGAVGAANIVGPWASFPAIQITTSVLTTGTTWFIGCAPSYSSITLRRFKGESFSVAASSINFALQEKTSQGVNGSQIFSNTFSTVTWAGGTPITSFGDASVAADSCVYFVSKPGGGIAGTPWGGRFGPLEYTIDRPQ